MRVLAIQTQVSNLRSARVLTLLGLVLQCMTVSADTWDIQTVDAEGDVGKYTSLALDELGLPHISYHAVTNADLKYAYRDADGWHVQTLDSLSNVGLYTSLALDAEGFPHIGYYGQGHLKYAYEDSSSWYVDIVESIGDGVGASLVLDASGFPHITHSGMYSYQHESGWNHESVPSLCEDYLGTSLALDAAGWAHVTFVSYEPNDWLMRYAFKTGGSWQTEIPDASPTAGAGSSLLINASGFPCVSYIAVGYGHWYVKYGWRDHSGWHIQVVDDVDYGWDRWWTSLVLDSGGFPLFSYWREGSLVIQHWDGSWWNLETVDSDGDVGYFPSMALDASGRPHISYYDVSHGNLKYARLLPSEISLAGELQNGQLCLTWSPVDGVEEYWVFGTAEMPWFPPDLSPPTYVNRVAVVPGGTTTWSIPNGVGDVVNNWTYVVIAMENTNIEITRSNRVGEYDFDKDIP